MSMIDRLAERAVRSRLARLEHGQLTLYHDGDATRYGGGDGPTATLNVHDRRFYRAMAFGGHVGAAESYVRGEWTSDHLPDLVRLFARNRQALDGLESGLAWLSRPALAMHRFWNRNTRSGSRRNIQAHYDLGNEFFAAFLDETMTYSCGFFPDARGSMEDASIAKYDRLCAKLEIQAGDHVIEIGSGWGGFAIHAAAHYGCRVTTTTISLEQYRLARERVARAGLEGRVTVLLQDYRDLEGSYDKLVSIEMVEAVGHQYLETYFRKCASLLAPHGKAAIQAITVRGDWYDPRQRQVDFIKRYIFPGSFIPSIPALASSAGVTDMRLVHLEDITQHYVHTLRRWRHRFHQNWDQVRALGFDERFRRLWDFYLCYCEGGFAEEVLGTVQLVFAKPLSRGSLERSARTHQVAAVA
ncbi:MAG: cyclopropane-fatty-acyl-phospholipid synthase family protein [Longimicrobiales bacterium]